RRRERRTRKQRLPFPEYARPHRLLASSPCDSLLICVNAERSSCERRWISTRSILFPAVWYTAGFPTLVQMISGKKKWNRRATECASSLAFISRNRHDAPERSSQL